jgi:MAP/microtubule affinity-regulating kinase
MDHGWPPSSRGTLERLFFEICLGVQFLHREGIAHNDLKPENVIVDAKGTAKIIDFAYAKTEAFADDDQKSGTLMYAAPEPFRAGRYHTQKADIWSLGIVLFTMATGRFAFAGASYWQIIHQIMHGQVQYEPEIDPKVAALVRRMTRVNPNERPMIDEVLEDPFFDNVRPREKRKTAADVPDVAITAVENEIQEDIW